MLALALHAVSPLAVAGGGLALALILAVLLLPPNPFTRLLVYAAIAVAGAAGLCQFAYASAAHAGDLRLAKLQAETALNDARRQIAEREQDLAAAGAAAADARSAASTNAAMAAHAQRVADDYAMELAKRGPAGACALDARDLRRLSDDGRGKRGPRAPDAAPGGARRP